VTTEDILVAVKEDSNRRLSGLVKNFVGTAFYDTLLKERQK
jgi:hypothetical protein